MKRTRATPLLAAMLATAVALACSDLSGPRTDLRSARKKWADSAPAAYQYTLTRSCFCGGEVTRPVAIVVRAGVVESRTYVDDGAAVDPRFASSFPTIDGLFATIDSALARHAAKIDASYDAARGYPTHVFIDYYANAADDEVTLTASDLHAK